MRNSKLTRVIALLLGIMMMSCLGLSVCAVSLPTGTSAASVEDSTTAEALEILGDDKWSEYKEKYGSYPNYEGEPIVIRAVDAETSSLPEGAQVMGARRKVGCALSAGQRYCYLESDGPCFRTLCDRPFVFPDSVEGYGY